MVDGLQVFKGESFHSSRWDYGITGENLEKLAGLRVGFVGTGATGVQAIPELAGAGCEQLYVFQRTPSSVDKRNDFETDPEWAANRPKGYFSGRRD
jgi:cation diffusion facilitator CzcD-associated flavoprotein CzcO